MELMAVLVIVGLGLSMIMVSIGQGGPEHQVFKKIEQFLVQSEFASEHATISSEAMGLMVEPPQWQVNAKDIDADDINDIGWRLRWLKMGIRGWEAVPAMESVSLPPDVQVEMTLGGKRWDWRKLVDKSNPVVAISPSGETTPFVMELRHRDLRDFVQHLEVGNEGEIVWREAVEDEKARSKR